MSKWQPIDTAPKDENLYFFADPILGLICGRWFDEDEEEEDEGGWEFREIGSGDYLEGVEPTHWMRPPKPPVSA